MCWSPAPSTMCAPTRAAASSIRAAISVAFAWPPLSGSLSVRFRSPWCTAGGFSRTWPLWEGSRLPTRKCSTATSVPLACAITSAPSRSATTTTQAGRAAAAEAAAARCGSGPTRTEVSPMDWPSHCSCSTCPCAATTTRVPGPCSCASPEPTFSAWAVPAVGAELAGLADRVIPGDLPEVLHLARRIGHGNGGGHHQVGCVGSGPQRAQPGIELDAAESQQRKRGRRCHGSISTGPPDAAARGVPIPIRADAERSYRCL